MRIAVLVLVAGCAERPFPGPPELTLGVGDTELVPVEDGDPVPIMVAPQGGNIVWGAAGLRYFDPHQLELRYSLTPPEGRASERRIVMDLVDADDGFAATTALGHPVFVTQTQEFAGRPCVFQLEARDREGRSALVRRTVVPTWADPPP